MESPQGRYLLHGRCCCRCDLKGCGFRLSWNSLVGVRAGSSRSRVISQHLARLVFLPSGVGPVRLSVTPWAPVIRVRFGVTRDVLVPVSTHCLVPSACIEPAEWAQSVIRNTCCKLHISRRWDVYDGLHLLTEGYDRHIYCPIVGSP